MASKTYDYEAAMNYCKSLYPELINSLEKDYYHLIQDKNLLHRFYDLIVSDQIKKDSCNLIDIFAACMNRINHLMYNQFKPCYAVWVEDDKIIIFKGYVIHNKNSSSKSLRDRYIIVDALGSIRKEFSYIIYSFEDYKEALKFAAFVASFYKYKTKIYYEIKKEFGGLE